jgi:hypothetical protein
VKHMQHMHSLDRPLCTMDPAVDIGAATRTIFASIDCVDCLRRAIRESEDKTAALRELLSRVEDVS